jgi:hypothetical protein
MIKLAPIQENYDTNTMRFTKGMDSINDPLQLEPGKFLDCENIDLVETWPVVRVGQTAMGAVWVVQVNGYGVIKKESGDILCRAAGTTFQKYSAGSWSTVATITTGIRTLIVSFNCSDLTASAATTGTATTDSTNRTIVKSGGGMTINAYAGKIVRITSGTGSPQEKFIASNDLTTIYIEGIWETIPDGTSVFDVREVGAHVLVTNGTDTVFKYDGTTKTDLTTMTKWTSLEVAHNRLFGATQTSDLVYISNLGTTYFPKDNYIPCEPDGDTITTIKKNLDQVIAYKKNGFIPLMGDNEDNFSLGETKRWVGAIAPASVVHGNNFNFFLGYGGIYCFNALDNSSLDEGLPISRYINDQVLDHTANELLNAVGWIYDNKYFCDIGGDVFVYDIRQTQIAQSHVFTRYSYPQTITAAMTHSGVTYLGTATKSVTVGGTDDDGTTINAYLTTGRIPIGDKNQPKVFNRDYVNFIPAATSVSVYTGYEGGALTLNRTVSIATEGQVKIVQNRRAKDVTYKYAFAWVGTQMVSHEQFFTRIEKTI